MTDNAELIALRDRTQSLTRRVATLQRHVDAQGEAWIASVISAMRDAPSAQAALDTLDARAWRELPYSDQFKVRAIDALTRTLAQWSFIDAGPLQRIRKRYA